MSADNTLVAALIAHLSADGGLQALIGDPCRIADAPAGSPGTLPRLLIGRGESRPLAADGGGTEHRLSLIAESAFAGQEEARAIAAAVVARIEGARPEADGLRVVNLSVVSLEVVRSPDGARAYATVRVRAVTEAIP